MTTWRATITPPAYETQTVTAYTQAVTKRLIPAFDAVPLQALRLSQVENYYRGVEARWRYEATMTRSSGLRFTRSGVVLPSRDVA